MDLAPYKGITQFGRAWQYVLEHDTHAPGSVDRVLLTEMVRLCPETRPYLYHGFTPTVVRADGGTRPDLHAVWQQVVQGCHTVEECIGAIAAFTAGLAEGYNWDDIDCIITGGTEEEIIARGSDWCTDVARSACLLVQSGGIPARIVYLVNLVEPYSGHTIIEAYRNGCWGAVDTSTAILYRHPDGTPATTWDLMIHPRLVEVHRGPRASYTSVNQFTGAAIVNYSINDCHRYKYTVSTINAYYRSILVMAHKDWPGGLRWLHGEDTY